MAQTWQGQKLLCSPNDEIISPIQDVWYALEKGQSLIITSTSKYQIERKKMAQTWHGQKRLRSPNDDIILSIQDVYYLLQKRFPNRKIAECHCYYKTKCFPHFDYISKLARDCEHGVEKVIKSTALETSALQFEVVIKITFVGDITEENLKLVSKRKGKDRMSKNKVLWEASPVVCFQNDQNQESTLEYMSSVKACHKIFVKSSSITKATDENSNIVFIDKDRLRQEIIFCLEDPIRRLLDKWTEMLKSVTPTKQTVWINREMDNIRKHMLLEENKVDTAIGLQSPGYTHIVPENVRKYLWSHSNVTSFGVWHTSRFKVFVEKRTDTEKMENELTRLDTGFFEKYSLDFEVGKLAKKLTMKQGDYILGKKSENETIFQGTLGGFVKETRHPGKIYALTCNHVFPEKNYIAYADKELQSEIGKCVFTTREKSSDFAAIEMNKSVDCDVTLKREDTKETNARVYDGNINNIGFVHKIGSTSGTTTGSIASPEFYEKLFDEDNRESLFLVGSGNDQVFSEDGDSGALVFSRPLEVKQNYVNVIGMVYGTYQQKDERSDDEEKVTVGIDTYTTDVKSQDNTSTIYERKEQFNLDISTDHDHISCCYRIHPALDLFQENHHVSVKFRDDLPSSASTSPPSSEDSS